MGGIVSSEQSSKPSQKIQTGTPSISGVSVNHDFNNMRMIKVKSNNRLIASETAMVKQTFDRSQDAGVSPTSPTIPLVITVLAIQNARCRLPGARSSHTASLRNVCLATGQLSMPRAQLA